MGVGRSAGLHTAEPRYEASKQRSPSHKKTPPTMHRIRMVDRGAESRGVHIQWMSFASVIGSLWTREFLDAVVEVGDKDVSTLIHRDADGLIELAVTGPRAAPLGQERTGVRELLDVTAVVGHE